MELLFLPPFSLFPSHAGSWMNHFEVLIFFYIYVGVTYLFMLVLLMHSCFLYNRFGHFFYKLAAPVNLYLA